MKFLELRSLAKTFSGGAHAVKEVSLEVADGEFVVLLGPSGCGKTTTLRLVAGLENPTTGSILFQGRDVTRLRPSERDVGFVFQFYALYPHFTVRQNVLFPLECAGVSRAQRAAALAQVTERLGLAGLLDRYPRQLSGGEQQRVALARALIRKPALFLMDEPLGSLDAENRRGMREFIRTQHSELKVTTLYVTHDQEEALALADRVVVMEGGRVRQAGRPLEVYDRPADLFVARFVGSPGMNLVKGKVEERDGRRWFRAAGEDATGLEAPSRLRIGPTILGIRPEHLHSDAGGEVCGRVGLVEYLGTHCNVHLDCGWGSLVFRAEGVAPGMGEQARLRCASEHVLWFDPDSGARL